MWHATKRLLQATPGQNSQPPKFIQPEDFEWKLLLFTKSKHCPLVHTWHNLDTVHFFLSQSIGWGVNPKKKIGKKKQHLSSCLSFTFSIKPFSGKLNVPVIGVRRKTSWSFFLCSWREFLLCYQHDTYKISFLYRLDQAAERTGFPQSLICYLGDFSALTFNCDYKWDEHCCLIYLLLASSCW